MVLEVLCGLVGKVSRNYSPMNPMNYSNDWCGKNIVYVSNSGVNVINIDNCFVIKFKTQCIGENIFPILYILTKAHGF